MDFVALENIITTQVPVKILLKKLRLLPRRSLKKYYLKFYDYGYEGALRNIVKKLPIMKGKVLGRIFFKNLEFLPRRP